MGCKHVPTKNELFFANVLAVNNSERDGEDPRAQMAAHKAMLDLAPTSVRIPHD